MGSTINVRRSSIVIVSGDPVPLHVEAAAIHELSACVMMATTECMVVELLAHGVAKLKSCYYSRFQISVKSRTLFQVKIRDTRQCDCRRLATVQVRLVSCEGIG